MEKASAEGAGIRVLRQDSWEMLISFIISQRKSIPAIRKCIESMAASFGHAIETEFETVYSFPTAEALAAATDRSLHDCGLGYRLPYIQDAANKVNLRIYY